MEAGGGAAPGGVFFTDGCDDVLLEEFGDDARHGAIGEAACAGEFGPRHGVSAAEKPKDGRRVVAADLSRPQDAMSEGGSNHVSPVYVNGAGD